MNFFSAIWGRISGYAAFALAAVIAILSGAYYEREKGKQAQQASDAKQAASDSSQATKIDTATRQMAPGAAQKELDKDWSRD